jgi:hypothetical protein
MLWRQRQLCPTSRFLSALLDKALVAVDDSVNLIPRSDRSDTRLSLAAGIADKGRIDEPLLRQSVNLCETALNLLEAVCVLDTVADIGDASLDDLGDTLRFKRLKTGIDLAESRSLDLFL